MATKGPDFRSAKKTVRFLKFSSKIVAILKVLWAFLFVAVAFYYFIVLPKEIPLANRLLLVAAIFGVGIVVFRYLHYLGARCETAITWIGLAHDHWGQSRIED